jgi:acetate---CoA ligase (ADP-forming)
MGNTQAGSWKELKAFFNPRSIAVIGALRTEGKIGNAVVSNIIRSGFKGVIHRINSSSKELLGLPCHSNLDEIDRERAITGP